MVPMRPVRPAAFALLIAALAGCVAGPLQGERAVSVGTATRGYLYKGVRLSNRGPGYVRLRPQDPTAYGTEVLVSAIKRAAAEVERVFPGGYPLSVGDLSRSRGGRLARHLSHRSGRDADLLFYVRDQAGFSASNRTWLPFGDYGLTVRSGRALSFDTARNWHLVRTLVLDEQARLKWLFCSSSIKARLLRYAAAHEPSARVIARATWILHEPSSGQRHDDHFHVRVGCRDDEAQLGCREQPPFWPWLSDPARKLGGAPGESQVDSQLLRWLLTDDHLDDRSHIARRSLGAAAQPAFVTAR